MSDDQMLGASIFVKALNAAIKLSIDERLVVCKKTIVAVEGGKLKLTHKLANVLRKVLKSVTKNSHGAKVAPEQQLLAADLESRVFARSPRRMNPEKERVLDDVPTGEPGSISR